MIWLRALAVVLLLVGIVSCGVSRQDGAGLVEVDRRNPDSGLREIYSARRDAGGKEVMEGEYRTFYSDGRPYVVAHFKDAQLDGKCSIHRTDGKPPYVGWWRAGKPWDGVVQEIDQLVRYHQGKKIGAIEEQ